MPLHWSEEDGFSSESSSISTKSSAGCELPLFPCFHCSIDSGFADFDALFSAHFLLGVKQRFQQDFQQRHDAVASDVCDGQDCQRNRRFNLGCAD